MLVGGCDRRAGPIPVRMAVLLEGRARRVRVTTGSAGSASVRVAPGLYVVGPVRPALRRSVVSVQFDQAAAATRHGRHVVEVTAGRHQMLLLVRLRPLECNGLGSGG